MNLTIAERRKKFEEVVGREDLGGRAVQWKISEAYAQTTRASAIEDGLQIAAAVNLEKAGAPHEWTGLCIVTELRFPPRDTVHLAVYIHTGLNELFQRLDRMLELAKTSGEYSDRNNNVRFYLASDGQLYLGNKTWWESLDLTREDLMPAITVDKVVFAIYPPTASPEQSFIARQFTGYLASLVGPDRIQEIRPWPEGYALSPEMKRMPWQVSLDEVERRVGELGGYYPGSLLEEFHVAMGHLPEKHFVLLTGISGSGKTQLTSFYARAIHGVTHPKGDDAFFVMCPVRPDWTDPSGLIGYYDPISRKYVVPTFLRALFLALKYRETPVFICVDEMNLARVEYYFSDVLSAMESGEPIVLHGHSVPVEGSMGEPIPAVLPLPPNLFITGTVNIDETTHPFSDKVLDRANVIEVSVINIDGFLSKMREATPALTGAIDDCREILVRLASILAPEGVGFGYRVAKEFAYYYAHARAVGRLEKVPLLDALVRQKILPKVRGSERQRRMLEELGQHLQLYPHSRVAVERMVADLDDLGAFQYWR